MNFIFSTLKTHMFLARIALNSIIKQIKIILATNTFFINI